MKTFTEGDIRSKFITPARINGDKLDLMTQLREEVYFTREPLIDRGKTVKMVASQEAYSLPGRP